VLIRETYNLAHEIGTILLKNGIKKINCKKGHGKKDPSQPGQIFQTRDLKD
jgi:hypothetical protein